MLSSWPCGVTCKKGGFWDLFRTMSPGKWLAYHCHYHHHHHHHHRLPLIPSSYFLFGLTCCLFSLSPWRCHWEELMTRGRFRGPQFLKWDERNRSLGVSRGVGRVVGREGLWQGERERQEGVSLSIATVEVVTLEVSSYIICSWQLQSILVHTPTQSTLSASRWLALKRGTEKTKGELEGH